MLIAGEEHCFQHLGHSQNRNLGVTISFSSWFRDVTAQSFLPSSAFPCGHGQGFVSLSAWSLSMAVNDPCLLFWDCSLGSILLCVKWKEFLFCPTPWAISPRLYLVIQLSRAQLITNFNLPVIVPFWFLLSSMWDFKIVCVCMRACALTHLLKSHKDFNLCLDLTIHLRMS